MGKKKQTKEEEGKEAFAFLGLGCLITTIQSIVIFLFMLVTDFDWFTKFFFIFPIMVYAISIITFIIKMIQIQIRLK